MNSNTVSQVPFPLEIWLQVLHYLAPLVMSPYEVDNIDTLPAQRRLVSWSTGQPRINKWLALRLVCKAWSHWKWVPFATIRGGSDEEENLLFSGRNPISWAHIDGTDAAITQFLSIIRRNPGAANRLETLSVSLSSTQQALLVLSVGRLLPNLRNLSLSGDHIIMVPCPWASLEANFGQVKILRIHGIFTQENGTFTFPALQMLDLSQVEAWHIERLILPSLKHLSTKSVLATYTFRVIRDYGHQLVSICCPFDLFFGLGFEYLIQLRSRPIWDMIPSVYVLDIEAKHLPHLPPPPPRHPLRHLVLQLNARPGENPKGVTRNVLHALGTFQNIRGFWIDAQGLSPWERFWIRRGFAQANLPWTPLPVQPYPEGYTTTIAIGMLVYRWVLVHVLLPVLRPIFVGILGFGDSDVRV